MTDAVKRAVHDGVQTLRLARPEKKNALTQAMYKALSDAFEAGDKDDNVRAHVVLGAEGTFTAGNDIGDFLTHAQGQSGDGGLGEVFRFIKLLPYIKKPILAGVDGAAIGIGTTFLFHCDMVFATPRSGFATPFLNLGLVPEAGSSLLMTERMGYARAFDMLVMGTTYTSEQMQSSGLLTAIVAPETLEETVMAAATKLAKKPKEALQLSRQLMRGDPKVLADRIDKEAQIFAERLSSDEARAAFQAFLAKSSA